RQVHGRREDVVRRLPHVDVVVRVHALARNRRDHLVRVRVRRGAGARLEDVDRELVVELAGGDPVGGGGDPVGLRRIEQAGLGVDGGRRGLDPPEPADDVDRDRLAGDGEVVDRLAGLSAPELLLDLHVPESSSRALASSSSQLVSLTRGRPSGSPSERSCSSTACQPASSTKSTLRPRRSSSSSPPVLSSRPAAASSSRRSHVSAASFLFVPITPLGPRLIQPATYTRGCPITRPSSFGITPRRS